MRAKPGARAASRLHTISEGAHAAELVKSGIERAGKVIRNVAKSGAWHRYPAALPSEAYEEGAKSWKGFVGKMRAKGKIRGAADKFADRI